MLHISTPAHTLISNYSWWEGNTFRGGAISAHLFSDMQDALLVQGVPLLMVMSKLHHVLTLPFAAMVLSHSNSLTQIFTCIILCLSLVCAMLQMCQNITIILINLSKEKSFNSFNICSNIKLCVFITQAD